MSAPAIQWLGRLEYGWALRLQRARREGVIDHGAPEAIWLMEHDPVITTGLRGVDDLPPPDVLRARGVALYRVERGGLATWHGPGQLVGYLIVDLGRRGLRVKDVIAGVEDGVIAWLASVGVTAGRRDGYPGVWCGREKICAIGMHFRRGVSLHGFALNVDPDLSGFDLIVPCGIRDGGVTSVRRQIGRNIDLESCAEAVGASVWRSIVDRQRAHVKSVGTPGM